MNKTLIAAIILSAALFAGFALLKSEYDTVMMARDALKERQAFVADRLAAQQNFTDFNQQYTARQSDIQKIVTFMPETKHDDQIVSSIQSAAAESGFQLTNAGISPLTPTGSDQKPSYITTPITVEGFGQYQSIANFMKALEQNLRLYDVTQFSISNSVAGVFVGRFGGNALGMTLKMNAYNLK